MSEFVLGIETSCDETSAAIVTNQGGGLERLKANVIRSQIEHAEYGGVVPEIAARAHSEFLFPIIKMALDQAHVTLEDISAVAATCGPGLIGGVLVGAMAGKTIAMLHRKPFIPVNHLEGHALVCGLSDDIHFPYLLLLVSGGHCQFLEARGIGQYTLLGETVDDAAGEAFDKIARLLGLAQPGGPAIEHAAQRGDPQRFALPTPMHGKPGCSLSFSGLKTACRLLVQRIEPLSEQDVCDVAACLQARIVAEIVERASQAIVLASPETQKSKTFVVAGGVAANTQLQSALRTLCTEVGWRIVTPPPLLCTDNAAMIGWVGLQRLLAGEGGDLLFAPRPNWSVLELSPPKAP